MAKRKSRFWVVREAKSNPEARASHYNYRLYRQAEPPAPGDDYGWPGTCTAEFVPDTFHAASNIRLKPGQGPVELAWPLFRVKGD